MITTEPRTENDSEEEQVRSASLVRFRFYLLIYQACYLACRSPDLLHCLVGMIYITHVAILTRVIFVES